MREFLGTFREMIFSKRTRNTIILFLFLFITEIIVRLVTNTFIGYGLLRIGISSLIISMIITLITSYFNKIISKIIRIMFCVGISI